MKVEVQFPFIILPKTNAFVQIL